MTGQISSTSRGLAQKALQYEQRLWDMVSVTGGFALSGVWYYYTGMSGSSEDVHDLRSCAALALLPPVLVGLRRFTDPLLRPLQGILGVLPPLVRTLLGLAMPLVVSDHYYFGRGMREYDYMYRAVIGSVLASYVVLWRPEPKPQQVP